MQNDSSSVLFLAFNCNRRWSPFREIPFLVLYLKDGRERKTGLGSTDLRKQNNHIFHHTLV